MIQENFDLKPPPDVPAPRVPLSRVKAAAPDGVEWELKVAALARQIAAEAGCLTPSRLRSAAKVRQLDPPHPNHWGSFWNRLRSEGWRRGNESTSLTASRNAAREALWFPPPTESEA